MQPSASQFQESKEKIEEMVASGILSRVLTSHGEALQLSLKTKDFLRHVFKNEKEFKLTSARDLDEYTQFACLAAVIALSPVGVAVEQLHKYASILWLVSGMRDPPESIKRDYLRWKATSHTSTDNDVA